MKSCLKKYRWLSFLMVLGVLVAPLHVRAHDGPRTAGQAYQTGDAPYLMAFSVDPAPHFVIERADGTDRRIFAADVMPTYTNHVDGPGWSPSGQWFAWTANGYNGEINSGDRPFVLSADGQTRLTALDDMNRVGMAWSPIEDVLFVVGLVNPPEMEFQMEVVENENHPVTVRIGLLDAASDTWRSVTETETTYDRWTILGGSYLVGWWPDGSMAYSTISSAYSDSPVAPTITSIREEGTVLEQRYDPNEVLMNVSEFSSSLVFSPYGELTRRAEPTILQLIGVTTLDVTIPATNRLIGGWWSADGQKLLVHSEAADGSGSHDLWVWSRADNTITPVLGQADLADPFTLTNISVSPDFSRVFFVAQGSDGTSAHVVNLDGSKPLTFAGTPSASIHPVWNHTGQIGVAQESTEGIPPFAIYDIVGDAPVALGEIAIPAYDVAYPALSPNGLTAASIAESVYIKTLATEQMTVLQPDSRRFITGPMGEVQWHPSQAWVFLWEEALVAGGGYLRYTGVMNEAGTIRRPLGYCESPTPICLDWLPPQVNVATLTLGVDNILPAPAATVPTGIWLHEVIWSPDGTQLAFSDANRLWGEPTPFEVRSIAGGESIAVFEGVGPEQTVGWVDGQPQLVSNDVAVDASQAWAVSADGSRSLHFSIVDEDYNTAVEMVDTTGNVLWSQQNVVGDFHYSAGFSPDGQWVAVSSAHSHVTILDANTGAIVGGLPLIHSNAISFSPDGTQLAVAEAMVINIYRVEDLLN